MKFKILILFVIAIMFIGCNGIDKKKLEVIDGIQLGTSQNIYQKQLDSIGIEIKSFYTKSLFTDLNDIQNHQINVYISDIFDLSDFRTSQVNHYAILHPISYTGTDNVIGLNVIIGHTGNSILINNEIYDLTKENGKSAFNQNIPINMLNRVKKMLISKYGEPKWEGSESEYNDFLVVQGKEINEFTGDQNRKGKITKWETENIKIELFEGLPSVDAIYTPEGYEMIVQPPGKENNIIKDFDVSKGESPCVTYVFIKYKLKKETAEELGLVNTKL